MPEQLDVLLVSRKFPPSTGGMEEFSYQMYHHLSSREDAAVRKVTWGGSNIWLPVVLPLFAMLVAFHIVRRRPDVLYCTDGLLSPLAAVFRAVFRVPTAVTVYGLDITFDNWLYQHLVPPTFSMNDRLLCISDAAKAAAIDVGVPEDTLTVVPGGIDPESYYMEHLEEADVTSVLEAYSVPASSLDGTLLLSVGRLVRRKGFQWFADKVVPDLDESYTYVICGDGAMQEEIEAAIERHGLEKQVFPLGTVTGRPLKVLYNAADALIMPNIRVPGDMEGFGLVATEASSCGTPVVAADMEGMKDSVIDGKTGVRVEPESAKAFIRGIRNVTSGEWVREEVRSFTAEAFSWEQRAAEYRAVFASITGPT